MPLPPIGRRFQPRPPPRIPVPPVMGGRHPVGGRFQLRPPTAETLSSNLPPNTKPSAVPILPPINNNSQPTSGLVGAGKRVDILDPPAKPIPPSSTLPPINNNPPEQKKEVYKGAFEMPGAAPAPNDPYAHVREFEEDVEKYLVKFERACSNMSIALTDYSDAMEAIKEEYDMTLHPDGYWRMCGYIVDLCPAALEIMSSIADYGRGLASRYSKKYPDYWKNKKYEKLLIEGYIAQKEILETLGATRELKLSITNTLSISAINEYIKLEKQLASMEAVKSIAPANGGNFNLSMTESNIKNITNLIWNSYVLVCSTLKVYIANTDEISKYDTPVSTFDVKYTKNEARKDLEKDGVSNPSFDSVAMEELEALQRALKEVKWYNYRLEPHKRGKQYKIGSDNVHSSRTIIDDNLLDEWGDYKYGGDRDKALQDLISFTENRSRSGIKIPLVYAEHFENELEFDFKDNKKKMLDNHKARYLIVGELRNFRIMKGNCKPSNDPKNINYKTGKNIIVPKTFRGHTKNACTKHPCNWGIVAEVYVYPQYKNAIDMMNLFEVSYSSFIIHHDATSTSEFTLTNVALCKQGALNVDVMYDVEDFFKADDNHRAEKKEYERDVAEALRDERAGKKNAKSDKILKDADRVLNNLGYFKDRIGKPKWSERMEDMLKFPSGINTKTFERLNLATLLLTDSSIGEPNKVKLIKEAFEHIEKMANRYYWYLPKLGEPGYVGDTKESLEKKTEELLKKLSKLL